LQVAEKFPEACCLDGFLFWSGHDQLSFSTSHFEIAIVAPEALGFVFAGALFTFISIGTDSKGGKDSR
jgi:hypothetical protein